MASHCGFYGWGISLRDNLPPYLEMSESDGRDFGQSQTIEK